MDFAFSPRCEELRSELLDFMEHHVYPAEAVYDGQMRAAGDPHHHPAVIEDLKVEARRRGLWNLFLPDEHWGAGISNLDYAPLAEIMGRSPHLAPEACNCSAPDTGNMEVLVQFGSPAQQERWLRPLLAGEIRSCFAMTEPDVASSDATNIQTEIRSVGDDYVINGRKWWTSGAMSKRCKVAILMGKTDPDGPRHRQQSQILVPLDTPGVRIVRNLDVFGYVDREGHAEVLFEDVRVPASNLIGEEGGGFAIAQARLGPGRIHHCMRALGMAERALELLVRRAASRTTFGKLIVEQGVVQEVIANARMDLEMARLLVLKTAWLMDTVGNRGARTEVAAIKAVVPRVAARIIDQALQVHGAGGVSDDFPLASMYAHMRTLRIADGPDEVHVMSVARQEVKRQLGM
jgi:acyl-CoA dehydrogenase